MKEPTYTVSINGYTTKRGLSIEHALERYENGKYAVSKKASSHADLINETTGMCLFSVNM